MVSEKISSEKILGTDKKRRIRLDSPISYMEAAQHGLTKENFDRLKAYTGFDTDTLANILSITSRTIQRKKLGDVFKPDISEKMLEIADIYSFGIEVFGELERFQKWMDSKVIAIGNKKPVDLLASSYGRSHIKQLLGRISHGIFS